MENNQITTKTQEEILNGSPENLTNTEIILKDIMRGHNLTLEQAIEALDEVP